jgi:hypothetical protein
MGLPISITIIVRSIDRIDSLIICIDVNGLDLSIYKTIFIILAGVEILHILTFIRFILECYLKVKFSLQQRGLNMNMLAVVRRLYNPESPD